MHTDSLQALCTHQTDIYEADGEIDRTIVILCASFKGHQSPEYCVEDKVLKGYWKAGYRHKLYFHILQTYHQNDHNTVWEGQESQIKALSKSKHTDITVVVSSKEEGGTGGPWTASFIFSAMTHFHSKWPEHVERRMMLHWQKRDFSSQEQLNQRRIKSAKKKKKKSFSLVCVGCQRSVCCQHHWNLPNWFPPGLQRYHRSQFSLSFWFSGCGVVSFNKEIACFCLWKGANHW